MNSLTLNLSVIETHIANAYSICENKGATIPEIQNIANLADCIDSISTCSSGSINLYYWGDRYDYGYTKKENPSIGDNIYMWAYKTYMPITSVEENTITVGGNTFTRDSGQDRILNF